MTELPNVIPCKLEISRVVKSFGCKVLFSGGVKQSNDGITQCNSM